MDAHTALKCLTNIGLEYVATLKDRLASQEALVERIRQAHGTLADALAPTQDAADDGAAD